MIALVLASAAAAEPLYVLSDAPSREADRAVVAEHLGVEPDRIGVLPASDLRALHPWATRARLRTCQGPPAHAEDVQAELEQVVVALQRVELDDAAGAVDRAEARVVCVGDVLPRELLWELYFLGGVLAVLQDDEDTALSAFRTARNVWAERPWDERFPPDGLDLFEQAADGQTVRVALSPTPEALWVDGQLVRVDQPFLDLGSGQHLLQFGQAPPLSDTMLFDPQEATPTLVVPSLLPPDPERWVDPEQRQATEILAGVLPEHASVWVVRPETLVHGTVPELAWTSIPRDLPPDPLPARPPPAWPRALARGASVAAVAGVVGTAVTWGWARGIRSQQDPALQDRYAAVRAANTASISVAAGSAGLALVAFHTDVTLRRKR